MHAHELKPGDLFTHEGNLTFLERLEGPTQVVSGLLAVPFRKREAPPNEPILYLPADEVVILHTKPVPA